MLIALQNIRVKQALLSKGASVTMKQVIDQLDWFLLNANFNAKYTMFSLQNR